MYSPDPVLLVCQESSLKFVSESLNYSKPNQRNRTESCVEASNCQMKCRQGKCGLQSNDEWYQLRKTG